MGTDELRFIVKSRLLKLRSIHRLIETIKFKEAFDQASFNERESVIIFITTLELDKLEDWLSRHRDMSPANLSMRELRQLAKDLGVPNYQYLTKSSLLSEVHK